MPYQKSNFKQMKSQPMESFKKMKMTLGFQAGNNGSAPQKKSTYKKGIVQTPAQVNKGCKSQIECPSTGRYNKLVKSKKLPKQRMITFK